MEPVYYVPIIPMVLVNGCCGIGTGTSTNVPCFNPVHIIDHLLHKLHGGGGEFDHPPFYRGFKGTVVKQDSKYVLTGLWRQLTPTSICIVELPVGVWTSDYKKFLEELPCVKGVHDNSTDLEVEFTLTLAEPVPDVVATFKLSKIVTTSNMNLFDGDDVLHKYATVNEIMEEFYAKRLELYQKRKDNLLIAWRRQLHTLVQKIRYIQAVLSNELELRQRPMVAIVDDLIRLQIADQDGSYHYLTKLPMDSVSSENVEKLQRSHDTMSAQVRNLEETTIQQLWVKELEELKTKL
jgi:DNA topoisomerase-2